MKLLRGILLIYNSIVFGETSTEVPSDFKTQTSVPDATTDFDPLNRGFNAGWGNYRANYQWGTTPAPVAMNPIYGTTPRSRSMNFQCGDIGTFPRYQVSDHDEHGKCENCSQIGIKRAQMRRVSQKLVRIINGADTRPEEVPWTVEIYNTRRNGGSFKGCGATLIAANKVLSAAHCFHPELQSNRAGDYIEVATYNRYGEFIHYNYKAAAGLRYRELRDTGNSKTLQVTYVTKIAIPR